MIRGILRFFLFLLLSFTLLARFGFTVLLASEISSVELVEMANADRQKHSLQPLRYNKKLERAAFDKAENMFKEQYWAHYGPNNESPWQFILGAGYTYTYAGENLAKGFSDSSSVHEAWMASPTHRANILDPQFQEVGIAVVKGSLQGADIFLVVQMFGTTAYAPSTTPGATPYLKIQQPKDGDILDEGITNIRGEAKNLEEQKVTIYINKIFMTSPTVSDDLFAAEAKVSASQGDQVITVKAMGKNNTPLSDSSVVTIVAKGDSAASLVRCLRITPGATQTTVTYSCQQVITDLTITAGSVRYTKDANTNTVTIPVNSLPKDTTTSIIATVTFADGQTLASPLKIASLKLSEDEINTGILGGFSLTSLSLRTWGYIAFAFVFLLIILYAIEAAIKKKLMERRYELFAYLLLLALLFIAFNFGYVRI